MKIRKRAFTLTELLVVVIVIGVLAAVVLPKFSKIMETRKTTEAEEVMSAIRTEQEHRCALDKPYYGDINDLAEILPNNDTKHYTYSLDTVGMMASSKGTYSYTLKMPSYLDGRICCEGAECDKLNKDYPTCTDLTQEADYEEETNCAAALVLPPTPDIPCVPDGDGGASRSCGCSGTQTRTCDTSTGTWGPWSNCSRPSPECTPGSDGTTFVPGFSDPVCQDGCWVERGSVVSNPCPSDLDGQATSRSCGCDGTQTRSCNPVTGMWSVWSSCQGESSTKAAGTATCGCKNDGVFQYTCVNHEWSTTTTCSTADTNCCTGDVTNSIGGNGLYTPPTGASNNCGTVTHKCNLNTGQWYTGNAEYSYNYDATKCCENANKPAPIGSWYECTCSSTTAPYGYWFCTSTGTTANPSVAWRCGGCTNTSVGGGNGGCTPGEWCCKAYGPNTCQCMCDGGGTVVVSSADTSAVIGDTVFSFYYTEATNPCAGCPAGCTQVVVPGSCIESGHRTASCGCE